VFSYRKLCGRCIHLYRLISMFTFATFLLTCRHQIKRENTDYIKSLFWLSAFAFKIQKKISFLLGPFCIYKMARKFHWGCQQGRLFRKNISAEKIGGACGFLLVRWIAQWMLIFNLIYHFITYNIKQVLILFLA